MKVGIETMAQTVLLCAGCILIAQMIASNLYLLQARTCFHKLADQIECSQNDEQVVEQCIEEASRQGYRLECEKIESSQGESCLLLSLYYQLKTFSVWNTDAGEVKEGVIQGYAR